MSKQFTLKSVFTGAFMDRLVAEFGLSRMSKAELQSNLQRIFEEYIVLALSELGGTKEDRNAAYNEAIWHLQKAQKLLQGQPHPAGKMGTKLNDMSSTLQRVIEAGDDDHGADRAKRFVEKNLVRKLKQLWQLNTAAPFAADIHFTGHSAVEFILACFDVVGQAFPEIEWFLQVDANTASRLIKSVR